MTIDTSYKPKNIPLRIGIALIVLASCWSAGWYYAANKSEARLQRFVEKQGQKNIAINCEDKRTSGFPFRLELFCSKLSIASPRTSGYFENVRGVTQIFTPNHWIFEATGGAQFSSNGQKKLDATAKLYQLSIIIQANAPQIDFVATEFQDSVWRLPKLANLELHARAEQNATDKMELVVSGTTLENEKPTEFSALLNGDFVKLFGSNLDLDALQTWSKQGGTVNVKSLLVRIGSVEGKGTGNLQVQTTGRVTGLINGELNERVIANSPPKKKNLFPTPEELILLTLGVNSYPAPISVELTENYSKLGSLKLPALPKVWSEN